MEPVTRARPRGDRRRGAESSDMRATLEETLAEFDRYADAVADPRHRAMVRNYRDQVCFEITGDVERLLALMTKDAEYHVYGPHEVHLRGQEDIRQRYEWIVRHNDVANTEVQLLHLMVTDRGLAGVLAGQVTSSGSCLSRTGVPDLRAGALYRRSVRLAFFRSFDGDLAASHTYFSSTPTIEELDVASGVGR